LSGLGSERKEARASLAATVPLGPDAQACQTLY
jgi:hypothetical protein